jgi:hypothetical protein
MQHDIPEYRKFFGATHNSASGATQPLDEHILKLKIRKDYDIYFPFAAKPRAGQIVQMACDWHLGLDKYSPIQGQQKGMDIDLAIKKAMTEFMTYQPRKFDDGKDAEDYQEIKNHIPQMVHHAVQGLQEYYDGCELEG